MKSHPPSGRAKARRFAKVGSGILGLCLLTAQLAGIQPACAADASREEVPKKYGTWLPDFDFRGVIDDPEGFVNLRSDKRADAPVVAKVKAGKPFFFQRDGSDEWCKVKLAQGESGWMHHSRIRLLFTKDDLPHYEDEADEIDRQARGHGIDYYKITQGAVRGDRAARKEFFSVSEFADGGGAEEHWMVVRVVIHLMGDEALARFLRSQPPAFRKRLGDSLTVDATYPFEPREYLKRHFPRTAKILY